MNTQPLSPSDAGAFVVVNLATLTDAQVARIAQESPTLRGIMRQRETDRCVMCYLPPDRCECAKRFGAQRVAAPDVNLDGEIE